MELLSQIARASDCIERQIALRAWHNASGNDDDDVRCRVGYINSRVPDNSCTQKNPKNEHQYLQCRFALANVWSSMLSTCYPINCKSIVNIDTIALITRQLSALAIDQMHASAAAMITDSRENLLVSSWRVFKVGNLMLNTA